MTGGFIYDNWSPSRGEERSGSRNEGSDVRTNGECVGTRYRVMMQVIGVA
jgi:hypothetical protein